jgi:hypothetical protein
VTFGDNTTLNDIIYSHLYPVTIEGIIYGLFAMDMVILICYAWSFVMFRVSPMIDNSSTVFRSHSKLSNKSLMILIIIDKSLLALPHKTFALKIITQAIINNTDAVLLAIASIHLVIHLGLIIPIRFYLQTIYPVKEIPWASFHSRDDLVTDLMLLIFSIPLALPSSN